MKRETAKHLPGRTHERVTASSSAIPVLFTGPHRTTKEAIQ